LLKIIEKNRRKYTGISSKNNEFDRCRRKSKVSDPILLKIKIINEMFIMYKRSLRQNTTV